jgi:hypothetical protein
MALTEEQEKWVADQMSAVETYKAAEAAYQDVQARYCAERNAQEQANAAALSAIDERYKVEVETKRAALFMARSAATLARGDV